MDVDQDRFDPLDDLYLYCNRIEGNFRLMPVPITGAQKPGLDALREHYEPALAAGNCWQLKNVLRDIEEDHLHAPVFTSCWRTCDDLIKLSKICSIVYLVTAIANLYNFN